MRTVALLILALTASSVMSANTCPGENAYTNLLKALTTNGIVAGDVMVSTDTTASPHATTIASAKCSYTAGATVTCIDEAKLIPAIQQYIDNLKATLQTASGVRDTYIIDQRGEVIDVLASLRRINEISDDATIPSAYETIADLFVGYADEIATNFTAIVENFDDYQEARATCMDALLQAQAAILCNAYIDATVTGFTKTTGNEDITLTDTFLDAINDKCYNYFTYSARQSSIILTSVYSAGMAKLVSGLEALANNDATTAATDLTSAFTEFAKASFSATASQKPVTLPTECATSSGCKAWIESDIFTAAGLLVNDVVVQGGDVPSLSFTVSRALEGKERRLAATGGVPITLASYTFTTGFEKNPANVDNTENANSALRNGIVAVAVAALALVF